MRQARTPPDAPITKGNACLNPSTDQSDDRTTAIRAAFETFTPLSMRGLAAMVTPAGDVFCLRAFADGSAGLRLEGRSERYSSMCLIGLACQDRLGTPAPFETAPIADHLHAWAPTAPDLGDSGLVLWSQILRGEERAEQTVDAILSRQSEVFQPNHALASMETGFLMLGLAHAMQAGLGGTELATFAERVAPLLLENQHPETGLFSFGRKLRRKNLHRARMDTRLGSFASQVYPIMGLAAFAAAGGDNAAGERARVCADRLVELQGPAGQWWWVYHRNSATPAIRYPVYTVHQDAMGPMALLATALWDDNSDRYDEAILNSFQWFENRPECSSDDMVAAQRGVVWRAVQHDDPETTGRLGLGKGELSRMGRAAWFGWEDTKSLDDGFVCPECRPYHLGWILLAQAMYEDCVRGRTGAARSATP